MQTAFNLDIFDFSNEPALEVAPVSPNNPRCLDNRYYYTEKVELKKHIYWQIDIAKTNDGYHDGYSYRLIQSGAGGPVFIRANPHPDFTTARISAMNTLIDRLRRRLIFRTDVELTKQMIGSIEKKIQRL